MAFVVGRGRAAVPMRSAAVAAVVGLTAASAVLVFATNISHLVASPQLYGWAWDFATVDITSNSTPCAGDDFGLSKVDGVASVAEICYQNVLLDGRPVIALAFRQINGAPIESDVIE